jgi:hydrogenase maturation factor HypF (carbamoyltransferase family)
MEQRRTLESHVISNVTSVSTVHTVGTSGGSFFNHNVESILCQYSTCTVFFGLLLDLCSQMIEQYNRASYTGTCTLNCNSINVNPPPQGGYSWSFSHALSLLLFQTRGVLLYTVFLSFTPLYK